MKRFIIQLLFALGFSCHSDVQDKLPNVILIMTDDMGYETLGVYGHLLNSTPTLDSLARHGILFNHCIAQPLCTPSRVKIMTGLYNFRNYSHFGHLADDQRTFGHLFQESGYRTCIAGKWQLNGLSFKKEIPNWNDVNRPYHLGFDEYCLWQLNEQGSRFSDPRIIENGHYLETDEDDYGPDIFNDFVLNFIEQHKDDPFFVYYPMVLTHDPFVPTPDSKEWQSPELRNIQDTSYFKDMVEYTDKMVSNVVKKLKQLHLENNTVIIFTGDNGSHYSIFSKTKNGIVQGGKGQTTSSGTHVPLIASYGNHIQKPLVYDGIIDFSDFFATFADLLNKKEYTDGVSFWPLLKSQETHHPKQAAYVYYDPQWGTRVNQNRNSFAQTPLYKLYQDESFYDLKNDIMEKTPLRDSMLLPEQLILKHDLKQVFIDKPKVNLKN